jgi:hypothetical protein
VVLQAAACTFVRPLPRRTTRAVTGGGKWIEITTHADPLYQHLIVTADEDGHALFIDDDGSAGFGVRLAKTKKKRKRS